MSEQLKLFNSDQQMVDTIVAGLDQKVDSSQPPDSKIS